MALTCASCSASNDETDEVCFQCGHALSPITAGTVIGARYEIVSRLGKGGMGTVYRARDRVLDEIVALKLLRADLTAVPEMARRFRSEIKLARRVTHPNVCRIHDYGEDGRTQFISMELIEGVDLKQLIRRGGPLDPDDAFQAAIQVANGLQAIHAEGIIHRDLKTPNIMRDGKGVVRLMDFGIAKEYLAGSAGATATGLVVGTPEYMSPEQARGARVDPRSDIYALGIVIFELFTGEVPFHGDTPVATLFKQIQEPPPLDGPAGARLPATLVPELRKALAKDPARRHGTAKELADDLQRVRLAWRSRTAGPVAPTASTSPGAEILRAPVADTMPVRTPTPLPAPASPDPAPVPSLSALPTAVPAPTPPRAQAVTPGLPPRGRAPSRARVWVGLAAGLSVPLAVVAFVSWRSGPSSASVSSGTEPAAPRTSLVATESAVPSSTPPSPRDDGTAQPAPGVTKLLPIVRASATPAGRPGVRSAVAPRVVEQPTATAPPAAAVPIPKTPVSTAGDVDTAPPPLTPVERDGTLRIAVVPWAEIEIDGVKRGVSPPLRPLSLSSGTHVVRLLHPDYAPFRRKVTIEPGETATLSVDLRTEAFPK